MCLPAALTALGLGGGAAATAAGATAGAATAAAAGAAAAGGLASTLTTLGTLVAAGGTLAMGIQGAQAAGLQAAALEERKKIETQLSAVTDQRERAKFRSSIAQQRAELAARGVSLDSVTAVALGQTAAQEMAFQSQAIRSGAQATQAELSAEQRSARLTRASASLRGVLGAASEVLNGAPDLWPGLMAG